MRLGFFILSKTETICRGTQDILPLKRTKHQLYVYDKMQIMRRFYMPVLHFSSLGELLQNVCKQDNKYATYLHHTNVCS